MHLVDLILSLINVFFFNFEVYRKARIEKSFKDIVNVNINFLTMYDYETVLHSGFETF
jgi:hypothetical protein